MPSSPFDSYVQERFRGAVLLDEQSGTPAAPAAGLSLLYAGTDGGLKYQADSGYPTQVLNPNSPMEPAYWDMLSFSIPPCISLNAGDTNTTARPIAVRIPWRRTATLANYIIHVHTAGATLTANQNLIWLCTGAGVLIPNSVTADQSTAWTSTGAKVIPPSAGNLSVAADPLGYIYGVILPTGSTTPVFRAMNPGGAAININRVAGTNPYICFRDTATATGAQNISPLSAPTVLNHVYFAIA